ncbi:beta-1,3-galactosyltransferase 1 [Nerophis lumbriciformis]|uniref:beta-1,3-galactosyltransferase 1 n=1 Tax=Nerophis lumbriciformis TaxID=546530 RepID=UPI002AE03005|nr:beta-1,3-galactosyltransferase 1 [Nerophis lumbriciformis]
MRAHVLRRYVKPLVVSLVIFFSAYGLLDRNASVQQRPTPSPAEVRLLSPETYKYVLNQPGACKRSNPFLVFMVPVAPHESSAREAIRMTWGGASQDTLTLFYMGLPVGGRPRSVQDMLEEESRTHADVIQMDFLDTYQNLTIKTVMIMNWLAVHCPNVSYAMKVDSDMFVNVFYLLPLLSRSPRRRFITGSVISDGKPKRDPKHKWQISEQMYPEDSFPPYVSGAGYVFSGDLAAGISRASRSVRVVPLEDVYVGLCLRVLGVRPAYSRSWLRFRNLFEVRDLEYDRCSFARRVLVNGFNSSKLLHAWKDFSQGYKSCYVFK